MLGFGLLLLANLAGNSEAQSRGNVLHVTTTAAYGQEALQFNEWDVKPGETFQFAIRAGEPVEMKCRLSVANSITAALTCDYRAHATAPWKKAFATEPALGKCKDAVFEAGPARRVSLAVCITPGAGIRPPLAS